ncbi:MAG: HAD family hydrolase [Gemmatimonadaceae bacterium]|nr:HAD family hydrolase [Gemmatimonadaceae bacterium]
MSPLKRRSRSVTTSRADAVIFDLDGTLLDTLADLANSMNAVLAAAGYPIHPESAYRYFVGEGMETLVRRTLPPGSRGAEQVASRLAEMRAEYGRRWAETSRPYAGIAEMLDGLTKCGVPLAILSNKPDDFTRLTVETLLQSWSFAEVRGMRQGTPAKPDPAGARETAASLNVDVDRVVYVGDTATDMKTGRSAGMFTVGVTWGFREREELEANGAQLIIDTPEQLLTICRRREEG